MEGYPGKYHFLLFLHIHNHIPLRNNGGDRVGWYFGSSLLILTSNCFIMPVNRHEPLRHGSLLGTEPLEGIKERWKSDSTAKPALTALNDLAPRAVNEAGNHKVKFSKHTTSALAYRLCLSLLLSSGNVERNPGPESISQNGNFKLSTVKGLRICHLNQRQ